MRQIRQEIFAIYNKELVKYVDSLRIRQEIIEMVRQEEQFVTKSMEALEKSQTSVLSGIKHNKQHEMRINS